MKAIQKIIYAGFAAAALASAAMPVFSVAEMRSDAAGALVASNAAADTNTRR